MRSNCKCYFINDRTNDYYYGFIFGSVYSDGIMETSLDFRFNEFLNNNFLCKTGQSLSKVHEKMPFAFPVLPQIEPEKSIKQIRIEIKICDTFFKFDDPQKGRNS